MRLSRRKKYLLGAAILLLLVGGLPIAVGAVRLARVYTVAPFAQPIPQDTATVKRGGHLIDTVGACRDCHGFMLSGRVWLDVPLLGVIPAGNLRPVDAPYAPADWERAIRHGVGRDGRPLVGVSAEVLHALSDDDVAAMIAYLQTLPPLARQLPERRLGPLAYYLVGITPDLLPAPRIDHATVGRDAPPAGVTLAYGRHLVRLTCVECHGADLSGGSNPGAGLNITPGGNPGNWSEAQFFGTMRVGITPERNRLDEGQMPWRRLANFSNDELRAIWLYMQSVPPVESPADPTPQGQP